MSTIDDDLERAMDRTDETEAAIDVAVLSIGRDAAALKARLEAEAVRVIKEAEAEAKRLLDAAAVLETLSDDAG